MYRYNFILNFHFCEVEISTFAKYIFLNSTLVNLRNGGINMLIMFDYGHGGNDPGAVNGKRKESNDVLMLGKAVATVIRAAGITVDETRTTDTTLSLTERSNMERKKKYDYFISFHRNASINKSAYGVETYIFRTSNKKSSQLATAIQNSLVGIGFKNRGVKVGNFHVLRETYSPAVLLEVGFISNVNDNKLFDGRFDEIVDVISKAIIKCGGLK